MLIAQPLRFDRENHFVESLRECVEQSIAEDDESAGTMRQKCEVDLKEIISEIKQLIKDVGGTKLS